MSAVLIACTLLSPLVTRLLPDRLSNCVMVLKLRQNPLDPLRLLPAIPSVDPETVVPVSASIHTPLGRLFKADLLFPISQRGHRTCQLLETVHATYVPIYQRTLPSRGPEIARLAIHYICPADGYLDCADQRNIEFLPRVDCLPSLSPVDNSIVCHTAIAVDHDLAMHYYLEVAWLPTLIRGPNRGSERIGCHREPSCVRC